MLKPPSDNALSTVLYYSGMAAVAGVVLFMATTIIDFFGFIFHVPHNAILIANASSVILFMLGVLTALGGFLYGLSTQSHKKQLGSKVVQVENAKVLGRYAINGNGELICDENYFLFDDPRTKIYVRLFVPGQPGSMELRCAEQVWHQAGEGLTGTAYINGNWLGGFVPTIGQPQP